MQIKIRTITAGYYFVESLSAKSRQCVTFVFGKANYEVCVFVQKYANVFRMRTNEMQYGWSMERSSSWWEMQNKRNNVFSKQIESCKRRWELKPEHTQYTHKHIIRIVWLPIFHSVNNCHCFMLWDTVLIVAATIQIW